MHCLDFRVVLDQTQFAQIIVNLQW